MSYAQSLDAYIERHGEVEGKKKYLNSHPNVKEYKLISPSNEEYEIFGNLSTKCKELDLESHLLYRYVNQNVPHIKIQKRGNWQNRKNTIGWKLLENK